MAPASDVYRALAAETFRRRAAGTVAISGSSAGAANEADTRSFGARSIERRALLRLTSDASSQTIHRFRRKLLPMRCPGGSADALVHQSAAEIVGARVEPSAAPCGPNLTHET